LLAWAKNKRLKLPLANLCERKILAENKLLKARANLLKTSSWLVERQCLTIAVVQETAVSLA
jgi:hypothetical protein